jgi:hypothetical protein
MFMDEQTVNSGEQIIAGTEEQVAPDDQQTRSDVPAETVEETTERNGETDASGSDSADNINSEQTDEATEVSDDKLANFVKSKGIDPETIKTPEGRKMAEMSYNAERKMQETLQQKAAIERSVNQPLIPPEADNTAVARVVDLENKMIIRDFQERTGVTPNSDKEKKLVEFLEQPYTFPNGQTGKIAHRVVNGELTLDEAYLLSGAAQTDTNVDELKSSMRKNALKDVASRKNASRPNGGSTDQTQFSRKEDDAFAKGLDGLV